MSMARETPVAGSGNLRLRAKHPQSRQGVCADAIATLEGISREDTDRLALLSQQRAAAAKEISSSARYHSLRRALIMPLLHKGD